MANLIDDLQQGLVSRRKLLGLLTGAAGSVVLASAQSNKQTKAPAGIVEPPRLSPANIGGGGRIERDFYREWLKQSKVPGIEGYSLLDATKQEVQPWPEIGGRGLYLNFSGNVHMDGAIQEIPPCKALEPRRHFYEQIVYVLAGRGYTNVGSGNRPNKVSWGEGSLFTVPVNALHRHVNTDPAHPARLLFITTFPFMIQVFGSMGLINDSNFSFTDRYDGAADYFTSTARVRQRWDKTNYVKDVRSAEVVLWEERGDGNASMYFDMGGNTVLEPHISEFEVGSYKRGHRHPYEAIILTLNGKGYSLAEKDKLKDSEAIKIDWQAGSIVSPPFFWYHQHFNTGTTKARYLAITEGDFPLRLGIPLQVEQIEANEEDPEIKRHFDRESHHVGN
jgi:quercetin dioxygenase-like cupin family protein